MVARVMILAGGTGGHIFPALAVAEVLQEKGAEIFWMGTKQGLEFKLVPAAGFCVDWVLATGWRGKQLRDKLKALITLLLACIQAGWFLWKRKPNVILGMGGFVSMPGGLMAWMFRIPLVVHEQNRIPGTSNRCLARVARVVLEAFPGSFNEAVGAKATGNPLRRKIARLSTRFEPTSFTEAPHILILGGSLGAQILNQTIPNSIAMLAENVEVLHQSGGAMHDRTGDTYKQLGINAKVEAFIDDMASAYRWADLVICRAGAMTISELSVVGLASILIPYPYAIDDHQTHNARYLSDVGAALLIPEAQFNTERLTLELKKLLADRTSIRRMAQAARSVAKLDAANRVADILLAEAA